MLQIIVISAIHFKVALTGHNYLVTTMASSAVAVDAVLARRLRRTSRASTRAVALAELLPVVNDEKSL